MRAEDLAEVGRIGGIVHPAYPERAEVPSERLSLFPNGCFAAGDGGGLVGYAISHPGTLGRPPMLDTLLGALPASPDCLYLHDVALLPAVRGLGLGAALLDRLIEVARGRRLGHLALVAVNRSVPYWTAHGFAQPDVRPAGLAAKLASYGGDAAYLVRPVRDRA
jgi:GNAT superfamily N-acetyltransferase